MDQKIMIIEGDKNVGYTMKFSLEKHGFACNHFVGVRLPEPQNGMITVYTIHGGGAEIPLSEYAVVFFGTIATSVYASADAMIPVWKKLGICCIGTSVVKSPTSLLAGAECAINPENFERWISVWFPSFYAQACAQRNPNHSI